MGETGQIEPVVLTYLPRKTTRLECAIGLGLVLLTLAFLFALVRYEMLWNDISAADLLRKVWGSGALKLEVMVPALVAVALGGLMAFMKRRSHMCIDAVGLQVRSTLPWLGTLTTQRIVWKAVSSASYVASTGILSLRTPRRLLWMVRATDWHVAGRPVASAAVPSEPDLVRIVKSLGLMDPKSGGAAAEFDLMKDRRTRLLIMVGIALGLTAVVCTLSAQESWAFFNLDYLLPHIAAATAASFAVLVWLSRGGTAPTLPPGIVFGMAVFAAIVVGPTSYVVGVPINQWLGGPLLLEDYHRDKACMNLVPTMPDLPAIEYTELTRSYWCQVPEAQTVQVLVRRGLFGRYQVSLAAQTADIRRFRGER